MSEENENVEICKACKGQGYVYDKKTGQVHTCWVCMGIGKMNKIGGKK